MILQKGRILSTRLVSWKYILQLVDFLRVAIFKDKLALFLFWDACRFNAFTVLLDDGPYSALELGS